MDALAYLVRHGMHDWLRLGSNRFGGRTAAVSLNAAGREEMERIARRLSPQPLDWIVASPTQRTLESAEIIAHGRTVDVESDARLNEWALGPWEGMWIAEIQSHYPEQWRTWREDPLHLRLPGAETLEQVADRMESACLEHLARGGRGIIVSHQDPLAALLCRLIGMPLGAMRALDIRTGSLSIVRRGLHGTVVEAVNTGIPLK